MSGVPIRNVQRPTFNSQLSTECPKGFMWAGYGDRHDVWADGGANRGTDTIFGPGRRIFHTRTQIWGQARCPVCRSGTFNVKRSTLNFQRCGRKGACWAGYGDRHGVTATPITGFLPVCTVASLSAVSVFFPGGVSRGQGTKSKQIFPSPAALRFPINWRRYGVFGRQATLVPTAPGWGICVPRPQFTASQKGIEEF